MVYNRLMKGQIALIVLLVSAVMMTIGLSMSKRTVVETKVDTDEESLKQAFNAAESGIEYYLKTNNKDYMSGDNKSSAKIDAVPVGDSDEINYSEFTLQNAPVYYWLREHNSDGSINYGAGFSGPDLRVCVDDDFNGALKVDYFYRTAGNEFRVWRSGYNFGTPPQIDGYIDSRSVALGSCTGRPNSKEILLAGAPITGNTPLLVTVKPLYRGAYISVRTDTGIFPQQGENISSTGRVGEVGAVGQSSSGASQTITVNTGYFIPGFMLEAINAEGNVLSN